MLEVLLLLNSVKISNQIQYNTNTWYRNMFGYEYQQHCLQWLLTLHWLFLNRPIILCTYNQLIFKPNKHDSIRTLFLHKFIEDKFHCQSS